MALARLDHVIFEVPDIEATHASLTKKFPEAWPIGRFWPQGRTSAVSIGGLNLELIQLDEGTVAAPFGTTLVFEPTTFDEAQAAMCREGIETGDNVKMEANAELLRLRGFTGAETQVPQSICHNLFPTDASAPDLPFEFFVCDYSPFLRTWLNPAHPRLAGPAPVVQLVYGTPQPEKAKALLKRLGYTGPVEIKFEAHEDKRILLLATDSGPLDLF